MDSKEFVEIRKKLGQAPARDRHYSGYFPQSCLQLRVGLVDDSRPHPSDQLLYLLSRKGRRGRENGNCWDLGYCPEERRNACPTWEFNAGEFCWFINGTICEGVPSKNWEKKLEVCKNCVVMR